jgi:hypothetical protein
MDPPTTSPLSFNCLIHRPLHSPCPRVRAAQLLLSPAALLCHFCQPLLCLPTEVCRFPLSSSRSGQPLSIRGIQKLMISRTRRCPPKLQPQAVPVVRPCSGGEAYIPSLGVFPAFSADKEVLLSLGRMEMMRPLSSLSSVLMQRTADLGGLRSLICDCQPHLFLYKMCFLFPSSQPCLLLQLPALQLYPCLASTAVDWCSPVPPACHYSEVIETMAGPAGLSGGPCIHQHT